MNENILKQLYEPFELKARKGVGNQTFQYVPSDDIVDRMNKVFKGSWETTVVLTERFEDTIIMHVKVSVLDPDSGQMFSHDGFASQPIARFTSGPNQGKAIEIGNAYKSAMSKAIKSAVTKWGVALYLDGKSADLSSPSNDMPSMPGAPINMSTDPLAGKPDPLAGMPGPAPSMPSTPPAVGAASAPTTPAGPPVGSPSTPPVGPSAPPISVATPQENPAPVFTNESVVKTTNEGPPVAGFDNTGDVAPGPSDVQKQAINHLAHINKMTYEALAAAALQTESAPGIDDLDYAQARTIIQYGNNLSNAS